MFQDFYKKFRALSRYGLIMVMTLASSLSLLQAQTCVEKTLVYYDMDDCESFSSNGSNQDFSEFTADYPSTGDCISVTAPHLTNQMGAHSCVVGANGSTAGICVEGDANYNFTNNDDDALRFSITVQPGQVGFLTELSFYQFSPTNYSHISGSRGRNNYLKRFGVRILKNGSEVYKSTGHVTNQSNWELETFDLSGDPDFQITTTTTFSFEILGYRPISSSTPRFFDVDEIKIKGCCANNNDPCAQQGGDNDNDGVCADVDCNDNNPNVPAPVGSACNDNNPNTNNDVIQSDGCTCAGIPVGPTPDCDNISVTTGSGSITVSGLAGAPITSLQIFNSSWQPQFSCFANCNGTETINVPAGTYYVYVKYYNSDYSLICQINPTVTVTGGGCPDADNDGVCDAEDCQPNNPAFPATPGSSCNDGNPNTTNDTVTADGCGCSGTPVSNCNNVTNGGQIGSNQTICAGDAAATLTNIQSPTGGFGTIEYIWLSSTSSCPTSVSQAIAGATGATYNPGVLSTTTYFVRCARRAGCSDWTVGESNCVTVTVDNSPNCGGGGGTPDCNDIAITTGAGSITVSGLDGAPISSLQIFSSSWQQQFSCFANCNATETVNVPAGTYYVYVKYYTSGYSLICQINPTVTVTGGGGCPDADNDGVCDADDCQPNNPAFPATPGTGCNDGNPNTNNDTVTADGCGCSGTPISNCDNVTNGGQIGFGNNCASSTDICGASGDVPNINSCQAASGGSGNIEYIWLRNSVNCSAPTVTVAQILANPSISNWQIISGATSASYDPGTVNTNTCYIRCARRAGCTDYLGESNIVSVTVDPNCGGPNPDCANVSISTGAGSITVSGLDGAPITSLQIFNSSWQQQFSCFANCNATETVNVPAGSYYVYVKYYTAGYVLICQENKTVTVTGGACPDADNDGVCDADDCQPNNPAFPATPGTPCNDGNPNTTNDVVTANGCGCAGTPNNNTPNCDNIVITAGNGSITVSGLDGAPISSLQIFNSSWQQQFSCFANCNATETVNVPAGTYYVYAKFYTSSYALICEKTPTVTVTGGGCSDIDNDGVCDADDCQPNNPAFPATPGTPCNDGNPNTTNDVITANGCGCAGTPVGCPDADNDGVCDADDCQPNNPAFPATPGAPCNDGNPSTTNDVVTANGCGCAGTTPVVTTEMCGNNCYIYQGNVDYKAIGNSMSYSEARDNCNKKTSSSASLNVPAGSTIVSAFLHWSGSGSPDNLVKLNGTNVYADQSFTDNSTWNFFGAYADVTSLVQGNGNYTVSGLSWDNSYNVCQANAAYGAWSLVVVYSNAANSNKRVHVCQDIFDYTYPAGTYNGTLHCIEATPGCSPNAELTMITFESDGYKGEHLYIGGQYFGDNNFNGQTAPNLDIAKFTLNNAFNPNSTSLTYSIQSYQTNTIWGPAIEGLFDFVKILKYDVCTPQNLVTTVSSELDLNVDQWEEHAEIEWTHADGNLVQEYILERSADEQDFTAIETITSQGYAGVATYNSYDIAPLTGDNFYRVKMTYKDGSIVYSAVEKVHFENKLDFLLFPNPANNIVKVNLESAIGQEATIHFYNNLGQTVKSIHLDEIYNKYYQIDIRDLQHGHYHVAIQIPGSKVVTMPLVISRM